MNLDKRSKDQAKLLINIKAISNEFEQIVGFPIIQGHSVNTNLEADKLLFINGAESMQIGIANDIQFYNHVFSNVEKESLHIIPDAGHSVHYQKKDLCIDLISNWLRNIDAPRWAQKYWNNREVHKNGRVKYQYLPLLPLIISAAHM